MSLSITGKALALLVSLGAGMSAVPAFAEPAETLTRMVSTAGLDLHSEAGRMLLRHRIQVAARKVCGSDTPAASLNDSNYGQCLTAAEQQGSQRANALIASANNIAVYAAK